MIKLPVPAGYFYHDDACGCEVAPPTPYYTEDQLKQAIRDTLWQVEVGLESVIIGLKEGLK